MPITLSACQNGKTFDLDLEPSRTALLLVDCTTNQGPVRLEVMRSAIAPVLQRARQTGIRPAYLYESGQGTGGPGDVLRALASCRPHPDDWQPKTPQFDPAIAPCPGEPVLAKWHYDGFAEGHIDYYLRTWNIDTLLAAGFRLPCCLYQTCLGARTRNYRVVLLRDCTCPPGSIETAETLAPDNSEGGWTRYVFMRWFEFLVGYTSTAADFLAACNQQSAARSTPP